MDLVPLLATGRLAKPPMAAGGAAEVGEAAARPFSDLLLIIICRPTSSHRRLTSSLARQTYAVKYCARAFLSIAFQLHQRTTLAAQPRMDTSCGPQGRIAYAPT